MINTSLEIHFLQENEVSIVMETQCAVEQEVFAQRLMLSLLASRHMVSMGLCVLSGEMAQWLYTLTSLDLQEMAQGEEYKGIRFIPYAQPARKHLKAMMQYSDNSTLEFSYKSTHFGLMPKRVGKSSIMSLQALLRHYVLKRSDDEYLASLVDTCKIVGKLFVNGLVYEYNIKEAAILAASQTIEEAAITDSKKGEMVR